MGILSRFKDIMKANMNAIMDQADDPEKAVHEHIRELNRDLGAVKAETAAVLANEQRARLQLDACQAEIMKLQRYAERSAEAGNNEDALQFLNKKTRQEEQLVELSAAYELASSVADSMKQLQDKLVSDIGVLESRYAELKRKLASVKLQEALHAGPGDVQSSLEAMEEKAEFAMNRAMALAELRSSSEEELRKQLAAMEEGQKKEKPTD